MGQAHMGPAHNNNKKKKKIWVLAHMGRAHMGPGPMTAVITTGAGYGYSHSANR